MKNKIVLPVSIVLSILFNFIIIPNQTNAQVKAFPGAYGFGEYITGGRAGSVYHVTNLADTGKGSFRDAVSKSNRIIVFDVSGYITLKTAVSCSNNLTIAGQTAPGAGIGFKGGEISFYRRKNIICRHIPLVFETFIRYKTFSFNLFFMFFSKGMEPCLGHHHISGR